MPTSGGVLVNASLALSVNTSQANQGLAAYSTHLDRTSKRMGEVIKRADYIQLALTRIATYTGIFTFFGGLAKLLKDNIDLNVRLAEVETLVDMKNEAAAASFNRVKQQLFTLDPMLGSTIELTKGLYEIMSAGVSKPEEALKVLVQSSKYAKAGVADFGKAAALVTSVMKAYRLKAEDMKDVTDMLFASVQEGKYHVEDFNDSIGNVLPTAAAMGVGVDEVSAAMAVLSQRGLSASESATALNRLLISFLNPLQISKKRFQELGIEFGLTAFASGGLYGALKQVTEAASTHNNLLPEIFRRERALRGGFILTGQGLQEYATMLNKVRGSTAGLGVVEEAYMKMNKTFAAQVKATAVEIQQLTYAHIGNMSALNNLIRVFGAVIKLGLDSWYMFVGLGVALRAVVPKILETRKAYEALMTTMEEWQVAALTTRKSTDLRLYFEGQAAAAGAAATRMKSLAGTLTIMSTAIVAAIIVYTALHYILNTVNKDLDNQIAKVIETGNALGFQHQQIERIMRDYEALGYATEGLRKELQEYIDTQARMKLMELGKASKMFNAVFEELLKSGMSTASKEFRELPGQIESMVKALQEGTPLTQENLTVMRRWAASIGLTTEATKRFVATKESFSAISDVMEKRIRMIRIETQLLAESLTALSQAPEDLAKMFDAEKLDKMLATVKKYLSINLNKPSREQEAVLGLFPGKSPGEIIKELTMLMHILEDTVDIKPNIDAQQRYEELWNGFKTAYGSIKMTKQETLDYARVLIDFANAVKKEMPAGSQLMDLFVGAIRENLEKVRAMKDTLPKEMQDALAPLFAFLPKETGEDLAKMQEKVKAAMQNIGDIQISAEAKIAEMLNKIHGEKYENVVVLAEKEVTLAKERLQNEFEDVVKNHGDTLAAYRTYYTTLQALDQQVAVARQLAQRQHFDTYFKQLQESLQKDFVTNNQKLTAAKAMYGQLDSILAKLGITDAEVVSSIRKDWDDFFKEYIKRLELVATPLRNWIEYLGELQGMLTALTSSFKDLAGVLGDEVGTSFTAFIDSLDAVAKGITGVKQSLELMEKAKLMSAPIAGAGGELLPVSGLDKVLGTIGQIGGVIGVAVSAGTALFSVFKSIFGKKKKTEAELLAIAVEDVQVSLSSLGKVSEQTAKKFLEFEKELGGAAAECLTLSDMMKDTGVNSKNFAEYMSKLNTALDTTVKGLVPLEKGLEAVGAAFTEVLDYVKKFGREGDATLVSFIKRVREMGISIQEIDDYVFEWLDKGSAGLLKMINGVNPVNKSLKELQDELAKYQDELKGLGSDDVERFNELTKAIEDTKQAIKDLTDNAAFNAQTLATAGNMVLGTFYGMIAQGRSFYEAYSSMSDTLVVLRDKYKQLGIEAPPAIQALLNIVDVIEKNKALVESIDGANMALQALGNTGFLTEDIFKDMQGQAKSYYDQLLKAGVDEKTALAIMAPMLSNLAYYAEQFGWKLDEGTLALIDQAKKAGVYKDKAKDIAQILEDGFKGVTDKLDELIKAFGGTKGVWDDYNKGARDAYDYTRKTREEMDKIGNRRPGGGDGGGRGGGGQQQANAGVQNNSGLSVSAADALSSYVNTGGSMSGPTQPQIIDNKVYVDGKLVYKAMLPYINKGGQAGDYEVTGQGVF